MTAKSQRTLKRWIAIGAATSVLITVTVIAGLTLMPRTITIQIINEGTTPDEATFEPRAATIQLDTTVVWKNTDMSAHTVTATAPAGAFDSGVLGPDEGFEFTFQTAGMFSYFCAIHPIMVGTVAVQ